MASGQAAHVFCAMCVFEARQGQVTVAPPVCRLWPSVPDLAKTSGAGRSFGSSSWSSRRRHSLARRRPEGQTSLGWMGYQLDVFRFEKGIAPSKVQWHASWIAECLKAGPV